jgi:hypothetical protein
MKQSLILLSICVASSALAAQKDVNNIPTQPTLWESMVQIVADIGTKMHQYEFAFVHAR